MNLRALSLRTFFVLGLLSLPVLLAGQTPKASAAKPGDHCYRPIPKAILASQAGVVSHTFKHTAAREAMETATLDGGVNLSITHWGCRATMLTITVEAKSLPDLSKDVSGGYLEAARQIRHLAALKARTGFNLERAARALEVAAKRSKGLAYIRPVSIPGSAKDKVTVQGAGPNRAKTANDLTFEFMRPLQKKK